MSVHTLDDIIDQIVQRPVKKQTGGASQQRRVLNEVWESYNAWVLDVMLRKKGADAPSFGTLSWEFFAAPEGGEGSTNYQMRCKPVFILSDTFKRQYQLPKKKLPERLQPTLSTGENVNFHKLALRYSSSLTKDMIFSGFRDIVRKIGEIIGSGKVLKLKFSVGTLRSKDRKVDFLFDSEKLKIQSGGEGDGDFGSTPVVVMRDPAGLGSSGGSGGGSDGSGGGGAGNGESYGAAMGGEVPEIGSENMFDTMGRTADTMAGTMGMGELQGSAMDDEDVITDPANIRAQEVQEEAYQRYIARLEKDAVEENKLNIIIKELQVERDEKADLKEKMKKEKAKNTQNLILGEISRKEEVRREEKEIRREPGRTSAYPLMNDLESALAEQAEGPAADKEEFEDNSNPYNVPVNRKFLGIPGVPKKGLGYRLSESELLQNLQDQMKAKQEKMVVDKKMKLDEEKRYIDHINMEIDFAAYTKQLTAYNKKKELMQAWEREAFLKKMQRMRAKGDIEGLRSHKSLSQLPSLDLTKEATAAAAAADAESSYGNNNQIDSSRSSAKFSSVGFDSRK